MPNRRELGYVSAGSTNTVYVSTGIYGRATGGIGSPTAVTISGTNYEYLTFTSTGTLTVTTAGWFDYLAVGGGSGSAYNGGSQAGGGGGAGAIVVGSIYLSANQTVTIGAGSSFGSIGTLQQGGNTSIAATSPFTQYAPGAANFLRSTGQVYGFTGSGTGGAGEASIAITTPLGFNGGSGATYGGGGGGFGGVGQPSSGTSDGGAGFDVSVFIGGSALYKASGGGGGGRASNGGSSLGNNGTNTATPSNGAANTGCGGGGGAYVTTTGNGGSGICYIRWSVS